jgi:hypothetical protein
LRIRRRHVLTNRTATAIQQVGRYGAMTIVDKISRGAPGCIVVSARFLAG